MRRKYHVSDEGGIAWTCCASQRDRDGDVRSAARLRKDFERAADAFRTIDHARQAASAVVVWRARNESFSVVAHRDFQSTIFGASDDGDMTRVCMFRSVVQRFFHDEIRFAA